MTTTLASSAIMRNLSLSNGLAYYATIKVTDRVGLARTVSRKFVVDTTGPTLGHVTTGNQEGYVMSNVTELRWSGFRDAESGLRHFRVNVSSSGGHGDIFPATTFHESSATLILRHLVDGHRYKLAVSAVNGAGLTTTLISDVIADTSPPSPGFVKAELQTLGAGTRVLTSWNRFQDSHSGVAEYRAGLGSRPATADLEPLAYMGLRQAMTWQKSLQSGQELYVIVEACNGAGLCVTSSSLPLLVDTSPPLPGSVHVGPPGRPSHFIHDSSMLTAQWFNFQDPHSGIDRYQWCVGTSPTKCDVTSYADHYLMTSLLRGNISLPVNTDLYLQVRAFNKVGLSCVGVSDRFRVDITAPVFLSPPVFLNPYSADSIVIEQQWEDSVFVVDWKVTDEDSPLVSQHLTMWAHGSIRIHDSLSEFGVGRLGPYVILPDSQVRLAPGDDVRINVTACNAAGLCARAASQSLLVDPTPPTVGGFRQEMTWTSTSTTAKVNLSWYGFEDAESSIRRVHVRVGRGYSDSILLGGTVVIDNRDNGTFTLTAGIAAGELLVLTIWAENGVGLISDVAKVTVEVIASVASDTHGFLLIQRHSCDPHFCTGDCTCAVVGGKCPALSGNSSCREVLSREDIMVSLTPTRGASAATASSSCLWGQWNAMSGVQRFEWSAGLETPGGQPVYGDGVFRPATEPVWHDVGLLTSFRHCLPSDRSLRHSGRYVVYVRAWYSASSYHVFTSSPLTVDRTPPTLRSATFVSAAFVHVTSSKDRRYESGELQVSWPRLFSDSHSNITDFDVMVGSHSAGDDVVAALNVGSRTNYKTNVTLHEGVPHHVTVVARNGVGLMTSHSVPPLLLDDEPPIPGVVFTSADYHDAHAQSDTSSVGASWHGFLDQHSAIADYQVAVVDTQMGPPSPSDFRSVGMETNVIIDNLSLRHGHVYRVHVRAVDSAGHVSEAAVSSEIRVDGTPAQAATCSNYRLVATLVLRGASGPNSTPTQLDVSLGHPSSVNGSSGGVVLRLTGQEMYRLTFTGRAHLDHGDRLTLQLDPVLRPLPRDHVSSITLSPMTDEELIVLPPRGDTSWMGIVNVTQCPPSDVTTTSDASKAVKLSMTSPRGAHVTVHVRDPESGVKRVMIGLGTMEGGFQIQPLKTISGHVILLPPGLPHATPIYVTAYVENGARQSSTFASYRLLDLTPPEIVIHKVKVVLETNSQSSKIVISGDWDVQDEESDVTGCLHSVGSGHGSTSLMDWSSLPSTGGSLQTSPLSAHHGDTLYITLWCWNSLGLDTRVTSDPLPVYLHAPISSTALVEIVADNVYSVTPEPHVQPAGGIVRMRWEGFEGDGVIGYQCTLSRDGEVLLNWTDAGLKNHISLHTGHMQEDTTMQITGQVRSYNKNGQKSPPVTATLTISTRIPQLTGKSMRANLTSPSSLLLDWTDVFVLPDQQVARFTLALGRLRGASDLLPPTSVSGLTYVFPVPSHSRLRSFHVFLRATLPSGVSSSYTGVALM